MLRGQEFVVRGTNLDGARHVVFRGAPGRRDDVRAGISRGNADYAVGTVPADARSGPLALLGARRAALAVARKIHVRNPPRAARETTNPPTFYLHGRRQPGFSFDVTGQEPVRVELLNEDSGEIVRTWTAQAEPGPASVRWAGTTGTDLAPTGRYRFRVAGSSSAATAATDTSFFYADHVFPIRGRHNLGYGPTNSFGGGGRRTHNGQDMFARCGSSWRIRSRPTPNNRPTAPSVNG